MPYIDRALSGKIVAGFDRQLWENQEFIPDDAPEWRDFLAAESPQRARWIQEELAELDRYMNRALEDVIHVLTSTQVVDENDLPRPLIQRMAYKERLRKRLNAELAVLPS
ncbi:MAG: hypothetical protein IT495_01530 [Gammaproteobacteria bacterium]|nr:hypothetical protein [Gammaproteobacteria bacterium]